MVASGGLGGTLWWQARRRSSSQYLSPAEQVYDDLVFWVRRLLRITPMPHQTPHEYAGVVVQNMPNGHEPVERIVSYYVEERFGGRQVPPRRRPHLARGLAGHPDRLGRKPAEQRAASGGAFSRRRRGGARGVILHTCLRQAPA